MFVSDLSGDEVEGGQETVSFSYRGVDYTIDLTTKEAAGFDKAVAMYVEHARKAGRGAKRPPTSSGSANAHAEGVANMKRWAAEQGIGYPKRGRLPKSLVEAYEARALG